MFANKVVLVTGGGSDIGATTVELFAKEGAAVAFNDTNETKLKEVVQRCEKHGAITMAIKADASNDDEAKSIITKTIDEFGKLDVLVNNAGIVQMASIFQPDVLQVYDQVMNTNLRSIVLMTSLAVPYLVKTKGNIINVYSSASIRDTMPGLIPYSVSKAGMNRFTRDVALELVSSGVRVNAVYTDMLTSLDLPEGSELEDMVVLESNSESDAGKFGDIIISLASKKSIGNTGASYVVENGALLK